MSTTHLGIRAGDTFIIDETDGSTTRWKLALIDGDFKFEPIEEPLPTIPGLYSPYKDPSYSVRYLLLTTTGEWFWLDFSAGTPRNTLEVTSETTVRRYDGLTRVFTYPDETSF